MGWLTALLTAGACGPVIDAEDDAGDTSDGASSTGGSTVGSATAATSASTSATTSAGTTGMTTVATSATSVGTTDPTVSTVTVTTDPSDTTDPTGEGLPDGESCTDGFECASGHCFVLGPLGGVCGQCVVDADCGGGGCTPPNPLAEPPAPSVCNGGGYGAGCMSSDACVDPYICALVIDVPGVLLASTCGECEDAGDCAMGWSCEPDIAVAALTGVKRCVAPGTLANGQTCDLAGDVACGSGHCAAADVLGVLQIGVCSGCEFDGDCPDAMVCEPPQVDLMTGVQPGACAP